MFHSYKTAGTDGSTMSVMKKLLVLLLLISTAVPLCAADLTGLWRAKQTFAAEVRGTLTIEREGDTWRADLAGRSVPLTIERERLSFELPPGEGSFRGELRKDRLTGFWFQPGSAAGGYSFATPVSFTRQRAGRWQGSIMPVDDVMTVYLPITRDADGTLRTFIRNPERNGGIYLGDARLVIDGSKAQLFTKRNKDAPERLETTGTWDEENDVLSLMLRGNTYDFQRATPADEARFYSRGKVPPPYVYRKPLAEDDGWPVGTLAEAGLDAETISGFMRTLLEQPVDGLRAPDIHAVLIARHGKLVLEEYFHGMRREDLHDTRSAAKVIASLLAGASKVPASTKVYETMEGPALAAKRDARAQTLTLEHLITMSSGLDCDDSNPQSPGNEDAMQEQSEQPDWYKLILGLNVIREPGTKSVYCSINPHLAGGVISRVTGRPLPELFQDTLAEPLGIRRYAMNLTPTGDAYMGGGVRVTARDFLKFAQLLLDDGKWHGRQIVSADWAHRSTSPLFELGSLHYGYLWWIIDLPYKDRTVRAFYAGGNGGQSSMAIPELDLAIVFFGGNYGDGPRTLAVQRDLPPKFILPAVK